MISIIICSRNEALDPLLEKNISETIGVPFEIVWIHSNDNKQSIFSGYNKGALKSKFDHLCFMHDDIVFHSQQWGNIVVELLHDRKIGIVGIAGAVLKTKSISPWWVSNYDDCSEHFRLKIIQARGQKIEDIYEEINPEKAAYSKVVVLDGVWFCCRKDVWAQTRFDDVNFDGFHFYDLDFCLSVLDKGYSNIVSFKILLEHKSAGHLDGKWISAGHVFHKKWEKKLPVAITKMNKKENKELEYQAIRNLILVSINNNYGSIFNLLRCWCELLRYKKISKEHFRILYSILKSTLKMSTLC